MFTLPRNLHFLTLLLLGLSISLTSCDDDDDDDDNGNSSIETPATYEFDGTVDYSGQTARIELLTKLSGKVGDIEKGQSVSEQELMDIFQNNGVISADKDLSGKTFNDNNADPKIWKKPDFEQLLTDVTTNSPGDTIADGRFFSSDGVELQQYIEKGLMGAILYWQATSVYLQDLDEDSNESSDGEASDRAHHFDEAFGYLGIPIDLPNNDADEVEGAFKTSSWFWGHYIRSRESVIDFGTPLFNAFLKGRTAIVNNNPQKREEAVQTILTQWEKLVASNVVHYINSTLSDMNNNDKYSKWHHWAEGKAFLMCLRYNKDKTISNSDWEFIDNKLKDSPKNIKQSDLEDANKRLQQIFNFSNSEMQNL